MKLEEPLMTEKKIDDRSMDSEIKKLRSSSTGLSAEVYRKRRTKKSIDLLAHILLNKPETAEKDFSLEDGELESAIEEAIEHRKKQFDSRCDSAKRLLKAIAPASPQRRQLSNSSSIATTTKALSLIGDLHDNIDTKWSWEMFRASQHVVHVPWSKDWNLELKDIMEFHGWELDDVVLTDNNNDEVIVARGLDRDLLPESLFPIHIAEKEPRRLFGWLDKTLKLNCRVRCALIIASIALAVVIVCVVVLPSWLLLIPFLMMVCALYEILPILSFNVPVGFHCYSIRVRVTALCLVTVILAISLSLGLLVETLTSVLTPLGMLFQNHRGYLALLPALMMSSAFFIEGVLRLAVDASRPTPLADFQVSVLLGVMSFTWPRFGALLLWFIGALALQLPSTRQFNLGPIAVSFVLARATFIAVVGLNVVVLVSVLVCCLARKQSLKDGIKIQVARERRWKGIVFVGFFFIYFSLMCTLDEQRWGKYMPIVCFGLVTSVIMSLFKTRTEISQEISKEKAGKDIDTRALVYPEHWECQVVDIIYFLIVEVVPVVVGIRFGFSNHASPGGIGWFGALWRGYLWGGISSVVALVMILQSCNLFMSGRASKVKRGIFRALMSREGKWEAWKYLPGCVAAAYNCIQRKKERLRNLLFDDSEDKYAQSERFRLGVERECHKELVRSFERQRIFPGILAQAPRAMFYEAFQNTRETVVGIISYQAEMTNLSVPVLWHVGWSSFVILLGYLIYVLNPSCPCSVSWCTILPISLTVFLSILLVDKGMTWLFPRERPVQMFRHKFCSERLGGNRCVFWICWFSNLSAFIALICMWRNSCDVLSWKIGLLILFFMMTQRALWISSALYEQTRYKDLIMVPAWLPCFISVIAWFVLTIFTSKAWSAPEQQVTLLPMSLLVVKFSTDAFRRIYPGALGKSFFLINGVIWSAFVLLMLGPAFKNPASGAAVRVKPTNVPVEMNLKRDTSHMYGLCQWRHGSKVELTALDLSQLAGLTYEENCSIIDQKLGLVFDDSSSRKAEMINCTNYNAVPRIVVIDVSTNQVNNNKTRIIAIKGTSTIQDFFADATFYSSIKVLQIIDHIVPVVRLIPIDQLQWFLKRTHLPGQVGREWTFFDHAARNVSFWVNNFTGDNTTDVILTGHSLGGAFAQIIAARLNLPALVFSSPGLVYSASRFGIYNKDLWSPYVGDSNISYKSASGVQVVRSRVHNVVPDFDQVPQVDRQLSQVDRIQCPHNDNRSIWGSGVEGAMDCHSLDATACEIWRVCGDIHKRFFDCPHVRDADIGKWINPDPYF